MIRAALAITAGVITGAVRESRPVRAICRAYLRLKLNLLVAEIRDTSDDILDAIDAGEADAESALTDFYVQLCNERDAVRRAIHLLT